MTILRNMVVHTRGTGSRATRKVPLRGREHALFVLCENSWTCRDQSAMAAIAELLARTAKTEMLEQIGLFQLAADRMRYLTARQTVVARNIANADTPGFQALDLGPFSSGQLPATAGSVAQPAAASPLTLVATEPGHFAASSGIGWPVRPAPAAKTYGEKPDGNTVSIEEQMLKQADIANNFALASAAYSKSISLMKIGIDFGK